MPPTTLTAVITPVADQVAAAGAALADCNVL